VALALAAVAYLPLMLTAPGRVGSDTKQYLYLDPGRLMARAVSMWDPHLAMGTVSHQNIGYLLPMGPWYWIVARLGAPVWVAQRLWLATLLWTAGLGILFVLATLVPPAGTPAGAPASTGARPRPGAWSVGAGVAAMAYMLSPYLLAYEARLSAILLPWAGLPWMLGLVARALRRGGWRHPAAFAVVVALVGSINATALVFAGVAPVLWVGWALISGEVAWRRALATTAKVAALATGVSLWWMAGLSIEAGYGMNILRYTETVQTVSVTSLASEALRGLGYWYFYGQDKLGLYLPMASGYMQSLWLIAVSFAVPVLGVLAALTVRWRQRLYFVALVLVGTVISVGTHPFADPSPLGVLFKAGATGSTVGLALRSTNRATPLVLLGLSCLMGAAVMAAVSRARLAGLLAAGAAAGLVAADLPALWTGQMVAPNLARAETIPSWYTQAAAFLQSGFSPDAVAAAGAGMRSDTRVLGLPGSDFAAYTWGDTVDPVEPGLMDRPYVARELVPYGSPGSVDLLDALDGRLQEGIFEPASLPPLARMISAGDVLVRSDLQTQRYNTPRPRPTWQLFNPAPTGLVPVGAFGPPSATRAAEPIVDETELGLASDAAYPPPLAVFAVPGARPILRAESGTGPLVMDGDGEGMVDAAAAGLLDADPTVVYSGSLAGDPSGLGKVLASGASLVVTDTNARQDLQWGTVRENRGYVQTAGEKALVPDPRAEPLDLFPDSAGDSTRTVAELTGVSSVQASSYGNPITYTPENRPYNAVDGNLDTAWTVAAFDNAVGQFLQIGYPSPVTTGTVNLVQPLSGPRNRWITRVTLRFDGRQPLTVSLGPASRTAAGQTVRFSPRRFRTLRITVEDTNTGLRSYYGGLSGVGFAEVRVAGMQASEVLRLPTDLLDRTGAASLQHRLTLVMTRLRGPSVPPRTDPEVNLARTFDLPTARRFSLGGTSSLSALIPDDQIDRLLGVPGSDGSGLVAYSSGRLPGDPRDRASATLDGDPTTAWSPGLGPQTGSWLEYELPRPVRLSQVSLTVDADGRHSVPTAIQLSADGGTRQLSLPAVPDSARPGATTTVTVAFPPVSGRHLRITFTGVREVTTPDYYGGGAIALPLGIAEVGIDGLHAAPVPAQLPGTCRRDLLSIDGQAVPVRVTGSSATAAALGQLQVQTCAGASLDLSAGAHVLTTATGHGAGIDINRLVLDSAPGGEAAPAAGPSAPAAGQAPPPAGQAAPVVPGPKPTVTEAKVATTSATLRVTNATAPFWVVLGESRNQGWTATVAGRSLGPPQLVDGYANGWLVDPPTPDLTVQLRWAPQNRVWAALALSAGALLACLGVVAASLLVGRRRRGPSDGRMAAELPRSAPAGRPWASPDIDLVAPWSRPAGGSGRWWAVALGAVGAGAMAGAVVRPWAAAPAAAAVVLSAAVPYARAVVVAAATGLLVAVDVVVTGGQAAHRYVAEFSWPAHFEIADTLALMAVMVLVADAVAEAAGLSGRARRRPPPPPP